MLLFLALGAAHAGDAEDLATSMAVPPADLVTATLTATSGSTAVETSLGTVTPPEGADFAWLFSGKVGVSPEPGTDLGASGAAGDKTTLDLELVVPSGKHSFSFRFYFLSAEYPEFVGSPYNDHFQANVTGTAWSGNAAIDSAGNPITINSALFTVTKAADLAGTGFGGGVGGGTGWLTVVVPVDPGDTIDLELLVADISDGIYDSGVAIDDFQWSESEIGGPVIITDPVIDWLSPKRGPTDGTATTTLFGSGFNESCVASFDGVAAPTTYVDDTSLLATPPAHATGLVDVTVDCMGASGKLAGGYTYFDGTDGDAPPTISEVDPWQVAIAGGDDVVVHGEGFADGATVAVDGVPVDATVLGDGKIELAAPAHDVGPADVTVTNPDGLADTLAGALVYVDEPVWPPVDTDTDTGDAAGVPDNKVGGGCSTSEGAASGLLAAIGLLLIGRRK